MSLPSTTSTAASAGLFSQATSCESQFSGTFVDDRFSNLDALTDEHFNALLSAIKMDAQGKSLMGCDWGEMARRDHRLTDANQIYCLVRLTEWQYQLSIESWTDITLTSFDSRVIKDYNLVPGSNELMITSERVESGNLPIFAKRLDKLWNGLKCRQERPASGGVPLVFKIEGDENMLAFRM